MSYSYGLPVTRGPLTECQTCGSNFIWRRKRRGLIRFLPLISLYVCDDCGAKYFTFCHRFSVKYTRQSGIAPRPDLTQTETPATDIDPVQTVDTATAVSVMPSHEHEPATTESTEMVVPPLAEAEAPLPEQPGVISPPHDASITENSVEHLHDTGDVAVTRHEVESFFGLRTSPFSVTPDPDFIYFSRNYRQVYAQVRCAIHDRQGYVAITGGIGCGKTTLCRLLMGSVGNDVNTALVINPNLSGLQLLAAIVQDFGITPTRKDRKTYLDSLNAFLADQWRRGATSVLILDEAQNMSPTALESVRVLSNFETNNTKLLQTIMVGQTELRDVLAKDSLTQLRQRITTWCHLEPLSREEVEAYIIHRLKIVAAEEKIVFRPESLDVITEYSQGTPRLVNVICDRILKFACFHTTGIISGELAAAARSTIEASRS